MREQGNKPSKRKGAHSHWKSGEFDRGLIREVFHPFVPAHAADSLIEIDLDRLWQGGKRLILLDVDHTIVMWKAEEFAPKVLEWIAKAKTMGFDLCIISNTRRVHRLGRLSEKLGIETVRGRFKPSRAMFRLALIKFKRKPEEAVMIGDQLMTDILGANRSGINAIWVRKMEGKEFVGTRVNRIMERILQSIVYKALISTEGSAAGGSSLAVQIAKFVIVGGSSFVIDFTVRWILTFHIPWGGEPMSDVFGRWLIYQNIPGFSNRFSLADPHKAAIPFFVAIAASLAIVNSFVWNRLWTFEIRGKEERLGQFKRFVVVSAIGLLLNVVISSTLANIIPGHPQRALAVATLIAAVIVAFWNFTGQRIYAFRAHKK